MTQAWVRSGCTDHPRYKGINTLNTGTKQSSLPTNQKNMDTPHTWFNFHNHWFSVFVPHLFDVQQIMWVAIVSWPTVHKDPRSTAATVHHDAIVQVGVVSICGFRISYSSKVPTRKRSSVAWQ